MTAESKVGSPLGGSVSTASRLRELLGAATPGRWTYGWDGVGGNWFLPETRPSPDAECCSPHGSSFAHEADVALIVAMHDALRPLLDVAEAAQRIDLTGTVHHKYALIQRRGIVHEEGDCVLCQLGAALAALDNRKDKP